MPLDLETTTLEIDGDSVPFKKYVQPWIEKARDERSNRFPSLGFDGEHTLEFADARAFESGHVKVNGQPVAQMELQGTVQVKVIRAVVVSAFEVTTRGRAISVQVDFRTSRWGSGAGACGVRRNRCRIGRLAIC